MAEGSQQEQVKLCVPDYRVWLNCWNTVSRQITLLKAVKMLSG